jgi:NAD-dependent SIR2 family protein deacetylase
MLQLSIRSSGKIWTKGSDDGRVCSLNGNLDLKICSKCNKSKVRSLYSGMEWENSPSRCNNCMMLGKKMNDNANEEAKERAAILMNIAFDMNVVKEMENIAK